MIVVDTQVIVYRLFPGPTSLSVEGILEKDVDWCAPRLWLSEFRNVAAGILRRGVASLDEVVEMVETATELIFTVPVDSERVLRLVQGSPRTAYDLEFVALAQQLEVPLVTNDRQVLEAFPVIAVTPAVFAAA